MKLSKNVFVFLGVIGCMTTANAKSRSRDFAMPKQEVFPVTHKLTTNEKQTIVRDMMWHGIDLTQLYLQNIAKHVSLKNLFHKEEGLSTYLVTKSNASWRMHVKSVPSHTQTEELAYTSFKCFFAHSDNPKKPVYLIVMDDKQALSDSSVTNAQNYVCFVLRNQQDVQTLKAFCRAQQNLYQDKQQKTFFVTIEDALNPENQPLQKLPVKNNPLQHWLLSKQTDKQHQ